MRSIQSRNGPDHAFNPHNNLLYSNFELVHFTHYMLQTCYTWCIQLEDIWLIYFFIYQSCISGDTVVSISSISCSWFCEFLQKVFIFVRKATSRITNTIIIIIVSTTTNGTPNECVVLSIRWDCVVFLDWFEVLLSSVSVEFVIGVTVWFVALPGRRSPVLFGEGCVVSLCLPGITFSLLASF